MNRGRRCVQKKAWRFAKLYPEHTSVPCSPVPCSRSDARRARTIPRPQLLGGFAGEFSPKGHSAPTFPQVSRFDAAQHPPKSAQKSRPMAKSTPISCETAQKSRDADADKAAAAISAPAQAQPAAPTGHARVNRGDRSVLRERLGVSQSYIPNTPPSPVHPRPPSSRAHPSPLIRVYSAAAFVSIRGGT